MSKISTNKQLEVWQKTCGCCWYCGKTTRLVTESDVRNQVKGTSHDWLTIEHMLPKAFGGTNDIDNLLPACRKCNCTKGKKTIGEYREYVSRLRVGAPAFTDEQVEYLRQNNIELPEIEQIKFWGES